jgi:hypothetical protein
MLMKILTAAGLVIMAGQTVRAGDWQYCLAPSREGHKIYMSPAFPTRSSVGDTDGAFGSMLDREGLPHDDVQCPRAGDANSIAAMQQYAIKLNQQNGNAIVRLPLGN